MFTLILPRFKQPKWGLHSEKSELVGLSLNSKTGDVGIHVAGVRYRTCILPAHLRDIVDLMDLINRNGDSNLLGLF